MWQHECLACYFRLCLLFLSLGDGWGFQPIFGPWGSSTCASVSSLLLSRSTSSLLRGKKQPTVGPAPSEPSSSSPTEETEAVEKKENEKEEYIEVRDWLKKRLELSKKDLEMFEAKAKWLFNLKTNTSGNGTSPLMHSDDDDNVDVNGANDSQTTNTNATNIQAVAKTLDWLQSRLGMNEKRVTRLLLNYPPILRHSIDDILSPRFLWLEINFDLTTKQELNKFIFKVPDVVVIRNETLEYRMKWYEERFDFENRAFEARKILKRTPELTKLDTESIESKLRWLQTNLELTDSDLAKMIKRAPKILLASIDDKLEPQLRWLISEFDLTSNSLGVMILKNPGILFSLHPDTIRTKFQFYEELLGYDAARELVIRDPSFLSRSLEKRLLPRLADTKRVGLVIGVDRSIHRFVKATDDEWKRIIDGY